MKFYCIIRFMIIANLYSSYQISLPGTYPSQILLDMKNSPLVRFNISTRDYKDETLWIRKNSTFVYIDTAVTTANVIFYLPIGQVRQMVFFKRPISRLLTSNNLVKFINTGSYANHTFKTELSPYLSKTNTPLKKYEIVVDQPTGENPPAGFGSLKPADFLNPGYKFVLTSELVGAYTKRSCFVDPMDSLVPIDYDHVRTIIFGSAGMEILMKMGITLASMTISTKYNPPIELIISAKYRNLSLLWPPRQQYEPVNKGTGRPHWIYLLGVYRNVSDSERDSYMNMIKSLGDSMDYHFLISRAHAQMLILAAEDRLVDEMHSFRNVIARLFVSLFAFIRNAFQSGYTSLNDIIEIEADLRLIVEGISSAAFRKDASTHFLISGTPIKDSKADLIKSLLSKVIRPISGHTRPLSAIQHLFLLRSAYALDIPRQNGSLSEQVSTVALSFIENIHSEAMRDILSWNTTTKHALYYAFASILQRPLTEWGASRNARRAILLASSMCTEEHVIATELAIQELYVKIRSNADPIHLLDVYTPCLSSLRLDLSEHHRIYAMADVVFYPDIQQYLKKKSHEGNMKEDDLETKAEYILTKLRSPLIRTLSAYASEVLSCSDQDLLEINAILILPVSGIGSYVVSRRAGMQGIVYTVDGVDVNNQLFITYTRMPCTTTIGNIVPTVLSRPSGKTCPYCGCVLLRYSADGNIRYSIYISSPKLQSELIAFGNSSIRRFNPTTAQIYGNSLLLYPNGTIVRILAFESERVTIISATYIATAVAGSIIALTVIVITVRMIIINMRYNYQGYNKVIDVDDDIRN
ncbi:UL22 envelope glycoprotein H [Meleagrid alphaherpesvirus 1]|uniref:UL22 envelope glycoprotein H n=1 Tax=Meleagrid herpesvirus 1 TaxID=37108 RepID=Q9DPR4_MEHV1|nr:envelope glycoprotein H [Meleagrid alphaherpesvirus 1]AKQ48593.1 envelope glycoprotein H [iBAC vector pMeHV1-C7]AKQ48665.1 envelope glycoprotein H [iBAC vector pMeHV1-C9]AKQ48737.1 envelope glycoprotein H [iBAC vector pMeHV1-C10]AKQ48809.1 envelope glycoprotein H [iBAC vector pMeHV1-C17]AKQ48881.1 envelope glycoprotein H [iBAC vector pMeHV1-C18]